MRRPIPPRHRAVAKALRTDSTDAERKLWSVLRAGQIDGLKFKRQVPLDGYIVDFVCFEAKLIIEVDGGQHSGSAADLLRDEHFRAAGFRTLRFWNNDVLENLDGVHERIQGVLTDR
jgi:very-short-patch-repair endonuclease